jgi:hypothetical protein
VIAVSKEAKKRATQIFGCPGKATAVVTRTTGLIAGAERRKAIAAGGCAPRATSRPAMGTEPHSHPGRATPASPAIGTATIDRLGSAFASHPGGIAAAIAPDTTTPSTRKGVAWTTMATKIVIQLCSRGLTSENVRNGGRRRTRARTTRNASSGRKRSGAIVSCRPDVVTVFMNPRILSARVRDPPYSGVSGRAMSWVPHAGDRSPRNRDPNR